MYALILGGQIGYMCVTHAYRNDAAMFVEERALLQALRDSELSKLDTNDALVMNMLLCDLFKINTQETTNDILRVTHNYLLDKISSSLVSLQQNTDAWAMHMNDNTGLNFPTQHNLTPISETSSCMGSFTARKYTHPITLLPQQESTGMAPDQE